jgi:hypothetical protein
MPKLINNVVSNSVVLAAGNSGYKFSAMRPDKLGATEYTLATITLDFSSSVCSFASELRTMLEMVLESCKKSPRANNLLVRVLLFSSVFPGGTQELHGFTPLGDIDPASYNLPNPAGCTPLIDAAYDSIVSTNAYGKQLFDQDFAVNAIEVIVTDGEENASSTPPSRMKAELKRGISGEFLESNVSILVGLNAGSCSASLASFQNSTGIDHYIDVADATPNKIAKLGAFISQSISSQSQSLGTGGPSQNIAPVI